MDVNLKCSNCGVVQAPDNLFCPKCGSSLSWPGLISQNMVSILPADTILQNHYKLVEIVGHGGMGNVYKAEDTRLGNRLIAVKEMSTNKLESREEAKTAVEQFEKEASLLARLQHPNLPTIIDCFNEDEGKRWYLVMSFIEGETLKSRLDKAPGHKLPTEEALRIGIELCTILEYLHTREEPIIFRDLKPTNVMITPNGRIYLIDFGIARLFKPGQSSDTTSFATLDYAPPEQFGFDQTNERSDIYSLGATLHHMLSGSITKKDKLPQHSPLGEVDATIPAPLSALITEMLEKDRESRPASAESVKKRLESILQSMQPLDKQVKSIGKDLPTGNFASTLPRILALRIIGTCCLIIGGFFCLPFAVNFLSISDPNSNAWSGITSSLALGAPLVAGGLVLIWPQNYKLLHTIEGIILMLGGIFFWGLLCTNNHQSLINNYNSAFVPLGVAGFFTSLLTLALGCFLFLRWTNVAGGAIMGGLLFLAGIIIFSFSQTLSANLDGQMNIFGTLSLIILLALGIIMIIVPLVRRTRTR